MCFSKYAFVVKWCSEILFITKFFSHRISEITGTWKKSGGNVWRGRKKRLPLHSLSEGKRARATARETKEERSLRKLIETARRNKGKGKVKQLTPSIPSKDRDPEC